MKVVILAGGSGTRLWPLSRTNYPKQFLKLFGDKTLLQNTAERFLTVVKPEDIVVITNKAYEFAVRSDLGWLKHLILEPVGRNTAPAIALAVKYCIEKIGCDEDEVIFVSPSDNEIRPVDRFSQYLKLSEETAQDDNIVTFGIKPLRPETGYGYIKANRKEPTSGDSGVYKVEHFVEKPDIETAKRYLEDGSYYWNSGMFAFTIATIKREFGKHVPDIARMLDCALEEMLSTFAAMPLISIDYAVMEKSANVEIVPVDLYWSDIGSWDALFDADLATEMKKAPTEKVIQIDSEDTIVIGDRRLIATAGVKDCVIVDTEDALLVAQKGSGQKVKNIIELLNAAGRKEASEHATVRKPWGSFTNLIEGNGYKVKRIVVNPGGKLSLQYHKHRSEHWIIVKGRAKVTVNKKEVFLSENETVFIPVSARHRVENCDASPLEIIEVQYGDYLGEDDIVRIEDVYGRALD